MILNPRRESLRIDPWGGCQRIQTLNRHRMAPPVSTHADWEFSFDLQQSAYSEKQRRGQHVNRGDFEEHPVALVGGGNQLE
jgi:hypothetical protein